MLHIQYLPFLLVNCHSVNQFCISYPSLFAYYYIGFNFNIIHYYIHFLCELCHTKDISISILHSSQGRHLLIETEDNKGEVNEQGADSINQSSDMKMLSKKGRIYFYLWFLNLKIIIQRCK